MENFHKALMAFNANKCGETYDEMAREFRKLVDDGTWMYFPCQGDDNGNLLPAIVDFAGKNFMVMFSAEEHVKTGPGVKLCMFDINKAIDALYANPHLRGIAINPFDESNLKLTLEEVEELSGKTNARLNTKDWGKGIPKYKESDKLCEEELLSFALTALFDFFQKDGYQVLEINDGIGQPANVVARKENTLHFIKIIPYVMNPSKPYEKVEATETEKRELKRFTAKFKGVAEIAVIGIGAVDPERFERGLALYGDEYHAAYSGLVKI